MKNKRISACLFIIVLTAFGLHAQDKVLTIDDMARWKYISSSQLTPNGKWVGYTEDAEEGDPIAHFYNVDAQKTYSFTPAKSPKISRSEKWAAFKMTPPETLVKELKRRKKKKEDMPEDTLAIFDFEENNILKVAGLQKFELPDSLPEYIVYSTSAPFISEDTSAKDPLKPRNEDNGYLLIVKEVLGDFTDTIFFAKKWSLSPGGHRLIAQTTAKDSTDQDRWMTYSLETGQRYTLYEGKGKVYQHAFSNDGRTVGVILDTDTTKSYDRQFGLHVGPFSQALDERELIRGMSGMEIHPDVELQFTDDGETVLYKQRVPPLIKDTLVLDDEVVDVEVWTTQDPYIYPMQNNNLKELKERGALFTYDIETKSNRRLTDDYYTEFAFSPKKKSDWIILYHNEKYAENLTWLGHDYKDVKVKNIRTGQEAVVGEKIHGRPRLSPAGKYVYWWDFEASAWKGFNIKKKKLRQWTHNEKVTFYSELHDYPALPWAYGNIGFNEDESLFYVYDRFDIWACRTDRSRSLNRITQGRGNKTKHRYIDLDRNDPYVQTGPTALLHVFSEKDKSSGYSQLNWETQIVEPLIRRESYFTTRVRKAENAERYLYTNESYDDFPDLRIADNLRFTKDVQVSHLNPQKSDFLWGDIELVEWDMEGKKQTGMLVKPRNFDRNKKYPVIINFYEKSSDRIHRHRRPYIHRSTINYHHYVSQGYVIFNPDVHYVVGDPGGSAFRTVMSGLEFLEGQGFVDSENVALQGHSWGGYQIAHILTKTDKFKCAESGAPVVNMTSAYGGIRWGSGMSRMFQYEKTQSRLGATLWEDQERYMSNSPLFNMDKMTTPVLILHNDNDGAVPWYQGIEYYMALRRLGKDAWLLNYRGEPHWPVKFQNRKDFHIRMEQFFNHYLKNQPLPEWMQDGIPAHERGLKDGYGSAK